VCVSQAANSTLIGIGVSTGILVELVFVQPWLHVLHAHMNSLTSVLDVNGCCAMVALANPGIAVERIQPCNWIDFRVFGVSSDAYAYAWHAHGMFPEDMGRKSVCGWH
jgi:hypothetical protein